MADLRIITESKSSSLNLQAQKTSLPKKAAINHFNTSNLFDENQTTSLARDVVANTVSESSSSFSYVNSGIQGATSIVAREGIGAELARKKYNKVVSSLDPTDEKGRTDIKIKTRKATPPVVLSVIEAQRSGTGPKKGSHASANKTNIGANKLATTLGRIGKGNVAVGITLGATRITTAENKGEETARVTGGVVGGVTAGTLVGAELGALGLNPYTVAAGVVAGGVIGGIGGEKAVDTVINFFKD